MSDNSNKKEVAIQSSFTEIQLRHGCFPVNLLHIFRTPFLKNTSERLFLNKIKAPNVSRKKQCIAVFTLYKSKWVIKVVTEILLLKAMLSFNATSSPNSA